MNIGVIGPGRVGGGLARLLAERGYAAPAVAGRTPERAQNLAASLPACEAVPAQEVADTCDLVFITTPDSAIAAVARAVSWRPGQGVVHCSGALPAAALAMVEKFGALPGAFHPLQTLPDAQAACANLPGSFVAIEAAEPLLGRLTAIADALGCAWGYVPPASRPAYHAAAVLVSNYTVALAHAGVELWRGNRQDRTGSPGSAGALAARYGAQPPPPGSRGSPYRPGRARRLGNGGNEPDGHRPGRAATHVHLRCNGAGDDIQ